MNEELKLLIEDAIDDSFSLPLKNDGTDDFELFAKEKKQFIGQLEKILVLRPTCGVEQRKFLDEVEKLKYEVVLGCDGLAKELGDDQPIIYGSDFTVNLQKVIKGK